MTLTNRFFRLLMRLRVSEPVYYWFLDRLTDNNGWRPLFYRGSEGRSGGTPWRP